MNLVFARSESDDPLARAMARSESAEARLRVGGSNPESRRKNWIASRSLSSGAHSRDPLARNDRVLILAVC
jgi:hypothetical protein